MRCRQCGQRQWLPQGRSAASQQGPPAGPPPPWEHQGSRGPRPGLAETKERVVQGLRQTMGKDAESQVRQLMGKRQCSGCCCPSSSPGVSIQAAAKAITLSQGSHQRLVVPSELICLSGSACLCYNHCDF